MPADCFRGALIQQKYETCLVARHCLVIRTDHVLCHKERHVHCITLTLPTTENMCNRQSPKGSMLLQSQHGTVHRQLLSLLVYDTWLFAPHAKACHTHPSLPPPCMLSKLTYAWLTVPFSNLCEHGRCCFAVRKYSSEFASMHPVVDHICVNIFIQISWCCRG